MLAVDRKTGEVFGPYKGYFVAVKELGMHETTFIRALLHGERNRRFHFITEAV